MMDFVVVAFLAVLLGLLTGETSSARGLISKPDLMLRAFIIGALIAAITIITVAR